MNYTLDQIRNALQQSWSADTSYTPDEWSRDNPARGQCVVSALVLQEYLGGDLHRYKVIYNNQPEKHYVNVIDRVFVDSTRSQYPEDAELVDAPVDLGSYGSIRAKLMSDPDTVKRYSLLLQRVRAAL